MMISVAGAISQLLAEASILARPTSVDLGDGLGRVLCADIHSHLDVPPADNSAMDGYALRHEDWSDSNTPLPISQRVAAGQPPSTLEPGTAARLFTGAEIPPGADTVVMQENTEATGEAVRIRQLPPHGANIRPRGQDFRSGTTLLKAGIRLRAQELGLLASIGQARVPVYERLKVGILSNGDELVEPGHPIGPAQIYNSNRYLLRGLVEDWGHEPVDYGIAPDKPSDIASLLERAAAESDVLLSSGGVSVGEEDHVKAVVESLGAIDLWKVAVKPGKPLAFGNVAGTPFFGLPGNPASAWVTGLVFARPYLAHSQGRTDPWPHPVSRPAQFSKRGSFRQEYLRARDSEAGVSLFPNQSSGVLLSACWGDGLVVQAPDQDIEEGDTVDFLPYASLR